MKWFANIKGLKRIELGDGAWIDVREELSVGQEREMYKKSVKGQTTLESGEVRTDLDIKELSFAKVQAYLADWNATNDEGKSVEVCEDAIRGMDYAAYALIENAVIAHEKDIESKKKGPAQKPRRSNNVAKISSSVAG